MIRLAFVTVLGVACAVAFGLYYVVGNTGGGGVPAETVALQDAESEPDTPIGDTPPEKFYFLRDFDLSGDDLTMVLYGVGENNTDIAIRDAAALRAAQQDAYVLRTSLGDSIAQTALRDTNTVVDTLFAALYRDDTLIASVECPPMVCSAHDGRFLAGLADVAVPLVASTAVFDDYTAYLDGIAGIEQSPYFQFLDNADGRIPTPQITPSVQVTLPTLTIATASAFSPDDHTAALRATLANSLPAGATLGNITARNLGPAFLTDLDNGRAVQVAGAPVTNTGLGFYNFIVTINGISEIDMSALGDITATPFDDTADLVAALIGTGLTCTDCYSLRPAEGFTAVPRQNDARPEAYSLTFYDLREAP